MTVLSPFCHFFIGQMTVLSLRWFPFGKAMCHILRWSKYLKNMMMMVTTTMIMMMVVMIMMMISALSSLQRSVQVPSHLLPFAPKGEDLLRCDCDCHLISVYWWIGRISVPFVFISTDQVSLNFTPTSAKASKLASKFFHLNDKRVGIPHWGMIFHHNSPIRFTVLLFQRLL